MVTIEVTRREKASLVSDAGSRADGDTGSEDSWSSSPPAPRFTGIRMVAALCGVVALVGCVLVATAGLGGSTPAPGGEPVEAAPLVASIPARSLLESPQFLDMATEQLMLVGRKVLSDSERQEVRAKVAASFGDIPRKLREHGLHETAGEFESLRMNPEQTEFVMNSLKAMSDPRVQRVGFGVASAIREAGAHPDAKEVKRLVLEKFGSRVEEIRQLNDQIVPAGLRESGSLGVRAFEFEEDTLHIMATFGHQWDLEITATEPSISTDLVEYRRLEVDNRAPGFRTDTGQSSAGDKAPAIFGTIALQARNVLAALKLVFPNFAEKTKGSNWVAALVGVLDVLVELVTCELAAFSNGVNHMEMMMCPMKLGSQGLEAIQALMRYFGIHWLDNKTATRTL